MTERNTKIAFVFLIFSFLSLSACKNKKEVGVSLQLPMEIVLDGHKSYSEVDQETIERLNLAVESCDGLTEAGTIQNAGSEVYRVVYEKPFSEYNEVGREPVENMVTVPEIAYVHPDPRYPNLVVALVDEKPAIFEFTNYIGSSYFPASGDRIAPSDLIAIYGLTTPDRIREIRVSTQEKDQKAVLNATITNQAEIQDFLDAIHDWDAWGQPSGTFDDPDDYYPEYDIEVDLENGFSFTMRFWPKNCIRWAMFSFSSSESLTAWIESHVKSSE